MITISDARTKKCSMCDEVLPVTQFYPRGNGYESGCIPCRSRYHAERRTNPGFIAEEIRREFRNRYRAAHGTDPEGSLELMTVPELRSTYTDCNLCGGEFGTGELTASIDHVIPVSDPASTHTIRNVHLVHRICNSLKSTESLEAAALRIFEHSVGVKSCTSKGSFTGCGRTKLLCEFDVKQKLPSGSVKRERLCKGCLRQYRRTL